MILSKKFLHHFQIIADESIYWYPLIRIPYKYQDKDFSCLGDEIITSFSYEVYDGKKGNLMSQIFSPNMTLIRLSRPSIIITDASKFMEDEIINAIYDTCLNSLRKENLLVPSDEIFSDMRDYIGQVLSREETTARDTLNRAVLSLSIITIFGVISSILGLIVILNLNSLAGIKSVFGFILLFATLFTVWYVYFRKGLFNN